MAKYVKKKYGPGMNPASYGHRRTHGMTHSKEWSAYQAAKHRCTNPCASDYKYYGGRGIKFKFKSFEEFFVALGKMPHAGMTVDRKNVNGHYARKNVRWATRREQCQNRRKRTYWNRDKSGKFAKSNAR